MPAVLPYLPMACPCFYPVEPSDGPAGTCVPLGDRWSGVCRAAPDTGWQPDTTTIRQLCNFGYARTKCPHVPEEGPDAVRFTIVDDRNGVIRIYWVTEKDHLPFAHGPLDYRRAESAFAQPHPDACIAQQAVAYVSSYLRRRGESSRL